MSNNYEIALPIPQLVTSSEKEARQMQAVLNQKVLGDVREVLQEMPDWQKDGDVYEKLITEEVRLRMTVDPLRSLVFLERSVSTSIIDSNVVQEHARQAQLLKAVQSQCNQAVNEVFDRAYVRAIERATRQLGDIQMEKQYDYVNNINSVRVLIRLTA